MDDKITDMDVAENDTKEANSFCLEYDNDTNEFFLGLANKNEDDVDVKSYLILSTEFFERFFKTALRAIVDYENNTGKNFLQDLKNKVDKDNKNNLRDKEV